MLELGQNQVDLARCAACVARRSQPFVAHRRPSPSARPARAGGRAATREPLSNLQTELPRLRARLDTPQGAACRSAAARRLLDRLGEEVVIGAAWRDTVDTFDEVKESAELCELRLAQLT